MAEGKTLWDGITGIVKFVLFGPPLILMGFIVLIFPESFFNNFGVWLIVFIILTIIYWILVGIMISSIVKGRRESKHQRELELAREKGRAFRGESSGALSDDEDWF